MTMPYKVKRKLVELAVYLFVALFLIMVGYCIGYFSKIDMAPTERATETVMVHSGDTLWSICDEYRGDQDIRSYIHSVKKLNNLDSALIFPGQYLTVYVD